MKLERAQQNIGSTVLYYPPFSNKKPETGIITSTNDTFVFVRYETDLTPKATHPENLKFENPLKEEL